jgi:hypothetical protein
MDVVEVDRLRDGLAEFTTDVFASLTRSGWQDRAGWYLQGLMAREGRPWSASTGRRPARNFRRRDRQLAASWDPATTRQDGGVTLWDS